MKNKKGMTLIEIIIAIAIMGIITVSFLNIFASGYIGILSGGKHTKVAYDGQKQVENSILNSTSSHPQTLNITFTDSASTQVETQGNAIVEEVIDGRYKIEVTTFIPNP